MEFAHPSEQEFARFLDYYRIRWQYEPVSFPIAWEGARVAEMFTPDFYLPEHDLYIEDSARLPYNPISMEVNNEFDYAAKTLKQLAIEFDLKRRWSFCARW